MSHLANDRAPQPCIAGVVHFDRHSHTQSLRHSRRGVLSTKRFTPRRLLGRVKYKTRRPHSSLGYRPPAPEAVLNWTDMGPGDVENATRFPHLHTPDGNYGRTSNEVLH
jgi:hypothetical protein